MAQVSNHLRRSSLILVLATFILILLGGYVKAIGAGLACPDWPLCYGKIFPFLDGGDYPFKPALIFAEWFHRLWAFIVGIGMLWVVAQTKKVRKSVPIMFHLGLLLMVLFGAQVIFGALTVTQKLDPLLVVIHLGNAIAIVMIEMTIAFLALIHSDPNLIANLSTGISSD